MYESALENVKSSFQPLLELAELNRKTLEKITSVQTRYLTDYISTSIKQATSLTKVDSPQQAADLSLAAVKLFESKLSDLTEQNLAALKELRDGVSSLVNDSYSDGYSRVTELCNLPSKLDAVAATATAAFKPAAAPMKKATVKKTAAKKANSVAAKAVTKTATTTAAKQAPKVEATPVTNKPVKKAVQEVTGKKPTVGDAIAKKLATEKLTTEKKAPVKRVAAKPVVKKSAAKKVTSAAKPAATKPVSTATKPASKAH